jgi:translation initiation factor IF-1
LRQLFHWHDRVSAPAGGYEGVCGDLGCADAEAVFRDQLSAGPARIHHQEVALAKEELLEFDGTVTEILPNGNFRVKLDNDHEILAYTAGKMRRFRIRTTVGDRVVVEMSPYDLERGRINFRHRGTGPAPATQRGSKPRRH